MKGDLIDVWQVYDRKKRKIHEIRVYETACESCVHRYDIEVCHNASRRQTVTDRDPCVLKCTGYVPHAWTEGELADARERIRNERPAYSIAPSPGTDRDFMDDLFDDSDEERLIAGFSLEEDERCEWH